MVNQIEKTNYLYQNKEITEFVNKLEQKYCIVESFNYENLVNFSKNKQVPFLGWLRYREGYAGTLVEMLMQMGDVKPGEIVVDPFCGSGTTSLVAMGNSCVGFGCDINPMSSFITSVKLTKYSKEELDETKKEIDNINKDLLKNTVINNKFESIERYFNSNNFEDLCLLKNYINTIKKNHVKEILMASFICIIEECSNRKKDGNGLKFRESKIDNVINHFIEKTNQIINDLRSNSQKENVVTGYSLTESAMSFSNSCLEIMKAQNKDVGAVIFSPPYANSFDYLETYKLELVFGEFVSGIKGLNDLRKKALRSFIGVEDTADPNYYVELLSQEIFNAIPEKERRTGKKDTRTRKVPNMIKGYFYDMEQVITECGKILKEKRKMFIVVDQSAYLGKIVPTDLLLGYLAEQHGFKVNEILKTKNALTSAQQLKEYPYLKGHLRGTILVLEKE